MHYLNANSTLGDIPLGTRCRFALYQDENGAFTKAWKMSDDFSRLAAHVTTLRVQALKLDEGRIDVAWQLTKMKNYNGDMEQVPDLGQNVLLVRPETRVWKDDQQVKLEDLAVGDLVLANVTGEQSGQPSHCTDIWIGEDTHKAERPNGRWQKTRVRQKSKRFLRSDSHSTASLYFSPGVD